MPLEAKRFRHVAVAIPQVLVSPGIAVRPRHQSPQPQQPDLAYHQTVVGWSSYEQLRFPRFTQRQCETRKDDRHG